MSRALLLATLVLALVPISGCLGGGDEFDFEPGTKFKETGRTVHLRATVVDLPSQEVVPGLKANLWAFCFQPVDPNDAYSAAAVQKYTPLEGDVTPDGYQPGECSVPGPTLRVKQGDRVKIEFSHSHFHPHTIHWHGQFVPWQSDGAPGVTQDSIPSGGAITYDFIAKRAGTLWYHCHVDTQFHVMNGLYGMMIVEPQDTTYEPKGVDKEWTMVLSTMNRNSVEAIGALHSHPPGCASGFQGCENPSSIAGEPDVFLLNGHSYPMTMDQEQSLYVMKPGERYRLRILNAGETVEEVHPHGHDMLVVAKDGNPLPPSSRYYADTLKIGPAERYDVVIDATTAAEGPWMIHTHVSSHETNCGKSPGGMHTMMVYESYLDKMHQFKAELPASCAGPAVSIPGDFVNATTRSFGTVFGEAAERTWTIPLDMPCAVERLTFHASLDSMGTPVPLPGQAQLTTVTVVMKDPAGAEVLRQDLTALVPDVLYQLEKGSLAELAPSPGAYTVTLSTSQAASASVDLFANVDYYETFEESKVGHLTYKVGGCPGFT
jgi:FtsP/CotA-like multicopper oxidase with cupredoxin domain